MPGPDPYTWQLFLGRKAFVPHVPVYVGDELAILEDCDLQAALNDGERIESLCGVKPFRDFDHEQRLVIEDSDGAEVRQDVPVSFADRQFTIRHVRTTFAKSHGGENDVALP